MRIPIFMIFKFVTIIGMWATKALEDGKITAEEGLELVAQLAEIIGIPLELDVPDDVKVIVKNITDSHNDKESAAILSKPDYVEPE